MNPVDCFRRLDADLQDQYALFQHTELRFPRMLLYVKSLKINCLVDQLRFNVSILLKH